MSWEINTNPEKDMFRLNELSKDDDYIKYTEDELEVIEKILKIKETGNL